jgi:hypothetical protein
MSDSQIPPHHYDYRRSLPHHQKAGRAIFVTFRKSNRDPFPANARDLISSTADTTTENESNFMLPS